MTVEHPDQNHQAQQAPSEVVWDIAIIGTGMGGATVGCALAKAGYRVVFIEKGNADFPDSGEGLQLGSDDPADRLRGGSWPTKITGNAAGTRSTFFPPMGCGAGGSTLLYAAALERFEPSDFSPIDCETPAAQKWPVSCGVLTILPQGRIPVWRSGDT